MKRSWIYGFVTVVLLVNLAIGAQLYLSSTRAAGEKDSVDANIDLFTDVLQKVRTQYVDGTNMTYRALTYAALKGMISKLDPHSEFLDPEAYEQLQDDTEGQFGGLGLVVGEKDGYVTVITPMDDTPGGRAGILSGDRIVKVGDQDVAKTPVDDVVKILRGDPGTSISLTIQRPPTGLLKTYTLTRAIIQMAMVKDIHGRQDYPVGQNKVGYARIMEFGDQTSDELESALQKLQVHGMKALVLDLRWNPGGLLDEAVGVCQKFLPRGTPVVSTEGRDLVERYFAKGNGDELKGMPIVVLVNLDSASASEIVTGCLQDLHRAYVIGERTFGKGSVQNIFPLDDGSALKLTVAKYYTPSHRVIHEHGIMPDSLVPLTDAQEAALIAQRSLGGIDSLPDERIRGQVKSVQDIQLQRAEDLLQGILIYNEFPHPEKVAAK
jgi:carboxyl-terminal processing protease